MREVFVVVATAWGSPPRLCAVAVIRRRGRHHPRSGIGRREVVELGGALEDRCEVGALGRGGLTLAGLSVEDGEVTELTEGEVASGSPLDAAQASDPA